MTISAFPTPTPSRSQSQEVFDAAIEAFLTHLPTFVSEANATAAAMSLNSTTDTSASSVAIGTGAKTFTVTAGKSFVGGMYVVIADAAAPSTNLMVASVTSYSGTALVANVEYVRGSGTLASWIISQSAPAADIAAQIHGATNKTTPVGADELGIWDSVTGLLNRVTWANLAAAMVASKKRILLSTSRDLATANGTFAVTGAGFTPSKIRVQASVGGSAIWSDGEAYGAATQYCLSGNFGGTAANTGIATGLAVLTSSAGNISTINLVSFDADGITLSSTKTAGSPLGTATLAIWLEE